MDELERGLAFEAAITMVSIVEELEVPGLGSEVAIATKPLGSEEFPAIGIIKAFHHSIAPWFPDWDEDHFDPQQETKLEDNAKGTRVTIAPAKAQSVVELEKVGGHHGPPTTDQDSS